MELIYIGQCLSSMNDSCPTSESGWRPKGLACSIRNRATLLGSWSGSGTGIQTLMAIAISGLLECSGLDRLYILGNICKAGPVPGVIHSICNGPSGRISYEMPY